MLKKMKSQQGYSLVTVLLVSTLLVTVGITSITLTLNSLKSVDHNQQSIKSKVQSENSIEVALAHIDREMELLNNNQNLNVKNALPLLHSSLEKVACLGEENGYTLEHNSIHPVNSDVVIEEVILKSPVGQSGRTLKKTLAISNMPEVFQYSAVSPSYLELNGASYIDGEVLVGGDMKIRNSAKFNRSGDPYWVETSYPALHGSLTVFGNYQYFKNNTWAEFTPNSESLNKYFSIAPVLKERELAIETILPKELVNEKKHSSFPISENKPGYVALHDYSSHKTINRSARFPRLAILNSGKLVINGDTRINGNLRIDAGGELIVRGDLYVDGNLKIHTAEEWGRKIKPGGKLTVEGSIKVMGEGHLGDTTVGDNDLTSEERANLDLADLGTITLTSDNSYIYIDEKTWVKNFNFTGKMYIESHLEVSGSFNSNGTVCVFRDAVIQDFSNHAGTLVIIADEGIKLSNNNQYEDTPEIINAYLYSNAELEIFGIGSHLEIHGGVHGNPLILNATKGKTNTSHFSNSFLVKDLYFQKNQNTINPTQSRLSIIYNKELVLNPPVGIPAVNKFKIKVLSTKNE